MLSLTDTEASSLTNLCEKIFEIHTDKENCTTTAMSNTKVMDLAIGQVHILNSTTFKPFIESMGMVLLSVILPITNRCQKIYSSLSTSTHLKDDLVCSSC